MHFLYFTLMRISKLLLQIRIPITFCIPFPLSIQRCAPHQQAEAVNFFGKIFFSNFLRANILARITLWRTIRLLPSLFCGNCIFHKLLHHKVLSVYSVLYIHPLYVAQGLVCMFKNQETLLTQLNHSLFLLEFMAG